MKRNRLLPLSSFTFIFISCQISDSNGLPDAVSTGGHEDAPWMWLSTGEGLGENNSGTLALEVVELVNGPQGVSSPNDLNTEPRFVGHLRKKLCKVGLGLGRRDELCGERQERVRRSAQFTKGDEDGSPAEGSFATRNEKSDRKGVVGPTSGRFLGGNGLDGLNRLLNPYVDPSFGVHFGGVPYGYGGYYGGGGFYGSGHRSPFAFNLGPLSINPLGGLRFTLRNGRPLIRPTLDLLITPKVKDHYSPPSGYYYPNRYVRDVGHPIYGKTTSDSKPIFKSSPSELQPSLPLRIPHKLTNEYKVISNKPPHEGFNFKKGKATFFKNVGPTNIYEYGKSTPVVQVGPNTNYHQGASKILGNKYKNIISKPPHQKFNFPKAKKVVFYDPRIKRKVSEEASSVDDGLQEPPTESEAFFESRDDIYAKQ